MRRMRGLVSADGTTTSGPCRGSRRTVARRAATEVLVQMMALIGDAGLAFVQVRFSAYTGDARRRAKSGDKTSVVMNMNGEGNPQRGNQRRIDGAS